MLRRWRRKKVKSHHVVFYTKAGCPLCLEARDLLHDLKSSYALEIEEVDIMTDEELYRRYKERIPVVIVDGQSVVEGRISERDLRRALEASPRPNG